MKILVLDGNENQAVACVRSLGRAGHSVVVGSSTSWSKAGWSRSAHSTFRYPAPQADVKGFVARIAEEVSKSKGTLVIPMTERTTLPLSIHREVIFAAGGRLVLPSHETLERSVNKEATTELAASLGIAVPQTKVVTNDIELEEVAGAVEYPVVLKPRSSEEFSNEGKIAATGAPLYARDRVELLAAWANLRKRCSAILVQEFIEGSGVGYFALMRDGELRAEFAHRRIRDVRPTGSGSCVRVSAEPNPKMREGALAILKALKWTGVAMVEFRMRGDTPVFLEVNGRFWNSLPLAVYAGADFPSMLASMAENGDVPVSLNYKRGLRCRWLLGDFRHLVEVWRGAPPGFAGAIPGRWRSLWEFLRPVPGTYHDNFKLDDPLPELGDWLDFLMHKLPQALKKTDNDSRELHVQGNYSRP